MAKKPSGAMRPAGSRPIARGLAIAAEYGRYHLPMRKAAPVPLPRLSFLEGEQMPKGTRVGPPFNADPEVGMV